MCSDNQSCIITEKAQSSILSMTDCVLKRDFSNVHYWHQTNSLKPFPFHSFLKIIFKFIFWYHANLKVNISKLSTRVSYNMFSRCADMRITSLTHNVTVPFFLCCNKIVQRYKGNEIDRAVMSDCHSNKGKWWDCAFVGKIDESFPVDSEIKIES